MPKVVPNKYDFIMSMMMKPGRIGDFELKTTSIRPGTVLNMYNRRAGKISKGRYTFRYPLVILTEKGATWMSDAQLEVESVAGAVEAARGDVLIGGLGIGLLPTLIKDNADSIDIVELHQEVIDLVFNQISTPKMSIIKDDIYHYLDTTSKQYDFIHIDIWNSITAPIKQIDMAREAAQKCLKSGGAVWCWMQELYDRIKDKLPREPTLRTNPPAIHEPCLVCGKTVRNDYAGLCMDCADLMRLSEMFIKRI